MGGWVVTAGNAGHVETFVFRCDQHVVRMIGMRLAFIEQECKEHLSY